MSKVDRGKKGTDPVCEVVKDYALRCSSPEGGTSKAYFGDTFDSLCGEREAVETRAIEDTESLEDEDIGEMWE